MMTEAAIVMTCTYVDRYDSGESYICPIRRLPLQLGPSWLVIIHVGGGDSVLGSGCEFSGCGTTTASNTPDPSICPFPELSLLLLGRYPLGSCRIHFGGVDSVEHLQLANYTY